MKTIQAFETTDGQIFKDKAQADAQQALIDFKVWYIEHKLYGDRDGAKVDVTDLIDWLDENREAVLAYLTKK